MSDVVAVAVSEGLGELTENSRSVRLREGAVRDNAFVKGLLLAEIGNNEEMGIRIKEVMDLQNIRVRREKVEDFGFLVKALTVGLVVEEEALINGLDSQRSVGIFGGGGVVAAVDDAEAASTDLLAELVFSLEALTHSSSCFWVDVWCLVFGV